MSAWLMDQARSTNLGVALITLLISELQTFIRQIHIPLSGRDGFIKTAWSRSPERVPELMRPISLLQSGAPLRDAGCHCPRHGHDTPR